MFFEHPFFDVEKNLLERTADLGITPLMVAISNGSFAEVKLLVDAARNKRRDEGLAASPSSKKKSQHANEQVQNPNA